jgi:hypothetical protein
MAGARYSADGNQSIGCSVSYFNGGQIAHCYAQDATSHFVSCTTTNATMISMMQAVSDSTYISFAVDSGGNCSQLYVDNLYYLMH